MTTPAKLYGRDLSEYDDVDIDTLLAQLSADEVQILAKEVDPDVSMKLKLLVDNRVKLNSFIFRTHFSLQINVQVTNVPRTQRDLSTVRSLSSTSTSRLSRRPIFPNWSPSYKAKCAAKSGSHHRRLRT